MKKNQNKNEKILEALSPKDDINDEIMFSALDYALDNENIKNLALTGDYGSGKSSLLRSYVKKRGKTKKILNISLANFINEEKKEEEEKAPTLSSIEKSILQQFFYKVSDKKIPYSKFRRVKHVPFLRNLIVSIFCFIFFLYTLNILKPSLAESVVKHLDFFSQPPILSVSAYVFLALFFTIIYQIVKACNKIRVSKIGIQSVEINLDTTSEESLLNKFLDEILYLFEETKYEVVIIEDLERFNNSEIFVKLRELNNLLNNYNQIKRKIVFLYATKDDLFINKNRTKFFDFILPVIPVLSPFNSFNKLLEYKKKLPAYFEGVEEAFLNKIGPYFDDMRLLINTVNEFIIYSQKLGRNINKQKLFAIILYKNLCPKDFAKISQQKGNLYTAFSHKSQYINTLTKELGLEAEKASHLLTEIEKENLQSIKELRILYLSKLAEKAPNNAKQILISQYLSDERFKQIKNQENFTYFYYDQGIEKNDKIIYSFPSLEKEVDPKYTYEERENKIFQKETKQKEILEKRIEEVKKKIKMMENFSLKQIFQEFYESIPNVIDNIPEPLLSLIKNGFIDENYHDYISYLPEEGS